MTFYNCFHGLGRNSAFWFYHLTLLVCPLSLTSGAAASSSFQFELTFILFVQDRF